MTSREDVSSHQLPVNHQLETPKDDERNDADGARSMHGSAVVFFIW
jgi:hypothetical protein